MFSTIDNFIGSKASQNKAILSVPGGVRFMIGQKTSKSGNHNLSKMTLAYRTTQNALAAPLYTTWTSPKIDHFNHTLKFESKNFPSHRGFK